MDGDELLTAVDVAAILRVRPGTVDSLARRGDLPSIFLGDGRIRRFRRREVLDYIESKARQ
ncbi:MAG: helix-turn-helix domain-containing protein [Solirubrobacteraceae bacterium]|nr:helix-turn-helix domain-containing protein [Solirubrobacteraceae bacterium]